MHCKKMNTVAVTPDDYLPYMNSDGVYIDKISTQIKSIRCGCGTNTIFTTNSKLKSHFKTNIHREWLILLNLEKHNHLKELEKYKTLCNSQKKIIQSQQEIIVKNETLILQQQKKIHLNETELYKLRSSLYDLD